MNGIMKSTTAALVLATAVITGSPVYADHGPAYVVTITNVTRGQIFAPVLVASHEEGVVLFEEGRPASGELAALAEGGDISELAGLLSAHPKVHEVTDTGGVLLPGESASVTVSASGLSGRISLAAMLVSTNDAFMAVTGLKAPVNGEAVSTGATAYDAGSEPNDELCAFIPGPSCGGVGGSPEAGGEGFVHVHAGIHGIGDLDPAEFDWRNPVAKVTVERRH